MNWYVIITLVVFTILIGFVSLNDMGIQNWDDWNQKNKCTFKGVDCCEISADSFKFDNTLESESRSIIIFAQESSVIFPGSSNYRPC